MFPESSEILTLGTCERDLSWKQGLCKWGPNLESGVLIRRGRCGHRDTGGRRQSGRDAIYKPRRASDAGSWKRQDRVLASSSQGERGPADTLILDF